MTDAPPRAPVQLVVAWRSEADPLIERLGLEVAPAAGPMAVFRGERADLVICGPGRTAAAAGVDRLWDADADPLPRAWLNIGIAGHREAALGRGFLAHRIREAATGRDFYPGIAFRPPVPTATVTTVDRPETAYPGDSLYDMEASGFFEAAARRAPVELIHAFKVVSDNAASPADRVRPERAREVIEANVGAIENVIDELADLAEELRAARASPPGYDDLIARHHFTATEREQLKHALRRWKAVAPGESAGALAPDAAVRGADILRALEARLGAIPARIA